MQQFSWFMEVYTREDAVCGSLSFFFPLLSVQMEIKTVHCWLNVSGCRSRGRVVTSPVLIVQVNAGLHSCRSTTCLYPSLAKKISE